MRQHRIFTDQSLKRNTEVTLDDRARKHAIQVLRLKTGSGVILFNGRGGQFNGVISTSSRKLTRVSILDYSDISLESPIMTSLAIGISRGERMDWIIQKATELGANVIQPLILERVTVKTAHERTNKRISHWRKIAISSCEQCGRNSIPSLRNALNLDTWLASEISDRKYILDQRGSGIDIAIKDKPPRKISILSGPEGGFSEKELKLAKSAGFRAISLGKRTMRAETAPLAALAIVQSNWGDMHL